MLSPAYNICHHMTKTLTSFDNECGMQQAQAGTALIYTTVIPNSPLDHYLQKFLTKCKTENYCSTYKYMNYIT